MVALSVIWRDGKTKQWLIISCWTTSEINIYKNKLRNKNMNM